MLGDASFRVLLQVGRRDQANWWNRVSDNSTVPVIIGGRWKERFDLYMYDFGVGAGIRVPRVPVF